MLLLVSLILSDALHASDAYDTAFLSVILYVCHTRELCQNAENWSWSYIVF